MDANAVLKIYKNRVHLAQSFRDYRQMDIEVLCLCTVRNALLDCGYCWIPYNGNGKKKKKLPVELKKKKEMRDTKRTVWYIALGMLLCCLQLHVSNHTDNYWTQHWPQCGVTLHLFVTCVTHAPYSELLWFSYLTDYSHKPIVKWRIWQHSSVPHSYQANSKTRCWVHVSPRHSTPANERSQHREGRRVPEPCSSHCSHWLPTGQRSWSEEYAKC